MARWDDIAQDVLENLAEEGQRKTSKDRVLKELGYVEDDIARAAVALQGGTTLTTIPAQSDYQLAAIGYRILRLEQPQAWRRPIAIIDDPEVWSRIVRDLHSGFTQPLYVTSWNGSLIFWPAPVDVQTLVLWLYGRPTVKPVRGADPTLESQWDDCLKSGGTYRMLKKRLVLEPKLLTVVNKWETAFETELLKVGMQETKRTMLGPHKVEHSSTILGF